MSKGVWVGLAGFAIVAGIIVAAVLLANHAGSTASNAGQDAKQPGTSDTGQSGSHNNQGGSMQLQITDETVGSGAEATAGKTVTVNYTGTLTNGKVFDSSYSRNQPFSFQLGAGQVIQGWDQGIEGMKVGGKRKLVIPPALAYGSQSPSASIPPNSTLVFEVELLDVK